MKIFNIHIITDKKHRELLSWRDYNKGTIDELRKRLASSIEECNAFRMNYEYVKQGITDLTAKLKERDKRINKLLNENKKLRSHSKQK